GDFTGGHCRTAHEDLATAGRIARTGGAERSRDRHVRYAHRARNHFPGMVDFLGILFDQRESHGVRPGLHGELYIGGDVVTGFDYLNRLAVDGHFDFGDSVVVGDAASTTHLCRIHAVEREVVAEGQPTRGTERQVVRTTAGCAPIRGRRRAD